MGIAIKSSNISPWTDASACQTQNLHTASSIIAILISRKQNKTEQNKEPLTLGLPKAAAMMQRGREQRAQYTVKIILEKNYHKKKSEVLETFMCMKWNLKKQIKGDGKKIVWKER